MPVPDPEPVDVGNLSGGLASALRNAHDELLSANFSDEPVKALTANARTLISALRTSLYAGDWPAGQQVVAVNTLKNLEEFALNANLLATISRDIENGPTTKALGVLRRQWNDCMKSLLSSLAPVAQSLDQLSVMVRPLNSAEPSPASDEGQGAGGTARQAG